MKRSGFKGLVAAGLVATSVAASTTTVAANDMFLKIKGVQGESMDKAHPNEIDVLSWSWGVSNGAGKVKRGTVPPQCIQDLSFTKFIDKSTAALLMMGVMGQIASDAVLTVRKAGDTPLEYLKLTMTNVLISSYQTGGNANDTLLVDNIVLHFESVKGEYTQQMPDGRPGQTFTFDITGSCP
jgi:type VI secretion system secreted protein Hcp